METTEIKKKGRVKHCYPRSEIYHRWVHSDEYVYTPKSGHRCAGLGNYLRICDFFHDKTNEDVKNNWCFNKDNIIAIIDRDKKRILINIKYSQHTYSLHQAIPDNFEIFYTDDVIINPDILQNDEELFKVHSKYLVEQIVQRNYGEYLCINNKCKLISNNDYHKEYTNTLNQFVNKHKIKKFGFYKECLGTHKLNYGAWASKSITINLPSIKDILTDKMFSKKEKLKIEQHRFYTEYCNGNGVSLKFLIENWDKIPTREEAIKYFESKTEFRNQHEWIKEHNELNWQELIKQNATILNNYIVNERNRCIKISDENYDKALEEAKSFNNYSVNAWREGNVNIKRNVTYRRFVPNFRNGQIGKWKDVQINFNINTFPNTQIKLSKDKKEIITSKGAVVPLNDAINKFKFINIYIDNCKKRNLTSYTFDNINVGIYNLRFIKYTDKKTDNSKLLNKKEWLVQIGCHSLWMDDILDFIHYYKLEKEFGLNDKSNVKLKIQIKK